MVAQKRKELKENPVRHDRGMIRRVDKYLAQQHGRELDQAPGLMPALPMFPDRTATLDDYHSAWGPLEFEYDSKETDPEEPEEDPEEDEAKTSVGSDSTCRSSGHDMDRTHRTNTINRNHRRNQRKRKENRGKCPTNAKKEEDRHKGKVVLSLFQDSPKEGALTYTD